MNDKAMKRHSSNIFIFWFLFGIILCINANSQNQKPELIVQTGHGKNSRIEKLAFSSDDKILVSADVNVIKIWDVEKNKELRSINVPVATITDLAFTPTDKGILTEGNHERIILWDIETGEPLWTIPQANGHISFSPDGAFIAIASSRPSRINILDSNTGNKVRELTVSMGDLGNSVFSPDNKMICATDETGQIQLLDAVSGAVIRTFPKQNSKVEYVHFSPKGNYLLTAIDKNINVWDVATGKLLRTINYDDESGPGARIRDIAFSSDNQTIAINGATRKLELWNITTGKPSVYLEKNPNVFSGIVSAAFGHQKKILAGGSLTSKFNLFLWNWETTKAISAFKSHSSPIEHVTYNPSGKTVVSIGSLGSDSYVNRFGGTGWGRSVGLWSSSGQDFSSFKGRTHSATSAFTPDSNSILTIETLENKNLDLPTVTQWDISAALETKNFSNLTMWSNYLLSPNGKSVAEINIDQATVQIFDVQTGKPVSKIDEQGKRFSSYNFSPDGKLFATGSGAYDQKNIKVWDVMTGKLLQTFVLTDGASALAFNRNGTLLATQLNESFKVFQVLDGKEITSLENVFLNSDEFGKSSIVFSADNRLVATTTRKRKKIQVKSQNSSDDLGEDVYQISIIDVANKKILREIGENNQRTISIAFSPDGKYLVSGGDDGQTKLWDVANGKELAKLITFDAREWLVITPEGLFDGSPSAWKQLMWRFDNNTFNYAPVEAYFNDFFYPNLLQDIMQGKRPLPPEGKDLSKIDRRRPFVNIGVEQTQINPAVSSISTRAVKVKIEVQDNTDKPRMAGQKPTSGAQDVRLFRNGSLVKRWRGDVLKGKKSVTLETDVPITAGDNNFTAYAFNYDNIKSDDGALLIKGAESLKQNSVLYVLAIGVNKYANPAFNLRYTVADAQAVTDEIKRQQEILKIYSRTEIITLFDEQATKQGILGAIKNIKAKAQPEDAVIIYFSGHGMANEPRFYLIPHDLGYSGARTKESLTPRLNDIYTHSLSDIEMENALEELDAGMMLLIIDACNSGQALEAEEKRRGPMNSKGLAQLAYEKGMYVLTASQSYEVAFESKSLQHSYLNYALIEEGLLTGKADYGPKDGNVFLKEWLNFAVQRVPLIRQEQVGKSKDLVDEEQKTGARVQQPRVFYRRENELTPIVIAKTNKP